MSIFNKQFYKLSKQSPREEIGFTLKKKWNKLTEIITELQQKSLMN